MHFQPKSPQTIDELGCNFNLFHIIIRLPPLAGSLPRRRWLLPWPLECSSLLASLQGLFFLKVLSFVLSSESFNGGFLSSTFYVTIYSSDKATTTTTTASPVTGAPGGESGALVSSAGTTTTTDAIYTETTTTTDGGLNPARPGKPTTTTTTTRRPITIPNLVPESTKPRNETGW